MTRTIHQESHRDFYSRVSEKAEACRIPIEAMIELTYGCNLRCVHCYNPTHKAQGELSTEAIYRILDQLAAEGTFGLGLTGGELFTRRDCFEIFDYAKRRGFSLTLLTNATMITDHIADRIRDLEPTLVEVSIYGATAETYEAVTEVPGSFAHFVRGVQRLRTRKVPLLLKMPVMTLNRHEVQAAKALAVGWGVRFRYTTEITPRTDGVQDPLRYRLSPADLLQVEKEMGGLRHQQPDSVEKQEDSCGRRSGLFTCLCGKRSLAVTPYGELNLCVALPIPQYDLKAGTIAEGWEQLQTLVERANAQPGPAYECPTCEYHGHCRQGPMDAFMATGALEPCLPFYKEVARLEQAAQTDLIPPQALRQQGGSAGLTMSAKGAHESDPGNRPPGSA